MNKNQADEAQTMETATVQYLPSESNEEEKFLRSERVLKNAIEQLGAIANQNLQQTQAALTVGLPFSNTCVCARRVKDALKQVS